MAHVANGLASAEGLRIRQIPIDPVCPRCGEDNESIEHIILQFPFARAVRYGSPLSHRIPEDPNFSIQLWLQQWCDLKSRDKAVAQRSFCQASSIYWSLWLSRNNLIFNKVHQSPPEVIMAVDLSFEEFWNVQHNNSKSSPSAAPNASFVANTSTGAWVFIGRDHLRSQIFAVSEPAFMPSIICGEAEAIRVAVLLALENDIRCFTVESDSMELIQAFTHRNAPRLPIASVITDIKLLCASPIVCHFVHVSRSVNGIPDTLARKGCPFGSGQSGLRPLLGFINYALMKPRLVTVPVLNKLLLYQKKMMFNQ
ncbi:uncharacterized protein LOC122664487 [Telopea speciosissima]|uniref:uncharacterized protein LOC122664487 n=1 Tax=Telopea speciosissima TaxID=54955 RepID=UPI001CC45051|nr:uncharacterized protein LOC122664487 [Telopea speciosissima]